MIIEGSRQKTLMELGESHDVAALAPASNQPIPKPKTWIESGGKKKSLLGDTEKKRDRETLKKYKNMYEQGGLVSTALDLYPLFILANGYRLEGDSTGEHRSWWDSIQGDKIIWQAASDAINYGDAFQENVPTRGAISNGSLDIVNVVPRNPIDFEIEYDEYGVIKNYVQVQDENTGTGKKLKPELITHIVLLPVSSSLYGLSLMKRAYDDIIRDTKVADASTTAMFRHGFKKYHIKVGREAELIPEDVLKDVKDEFEDLDVKNEFVTPHDIDIRNIDEGGLEKVEEYNGISLMRVAAAIGIPEELLGLRRGSTDNTAVSRIKAFFKKIQTFQRFIAQAYNTNVFDRRTGKPGSVKLVFSDPDPSDEAEIAGYISKVMMASPQTPFQVFPAKWIQKRFGIEGELIDDEPTSKPSQKVPGQKGQDEPEEKPPAGEKEPIA